MPLSKENLVRDLKNLISIASFENEDCVADYIISELKKSGLSPSRDRFGNVLLEMGSGDGFLLNAHMDTVGTGGWEDRALSPVVKSGRIYGRGSSDTKSGIAAMMEIARKLKNGKLRRRVIFLFTVREEDSELKDNGSYLASKNIDAKEGIILEPAFSGKKLDIGVGCKGAYRFRISVHGKSCHSAQPDLGVNPLYLASDFIIDFRSMKNPRKLYRILGKPVELASVSTITQIKAGEGSNVIPSECHLSIDYRALPDEKPEFIRERILSLCRRHFRLGFDMGEYCVEGYFDYDESTLKLIGDVASSHGYSPEFIIRHGRNDGCIFSKYAGIKCVCFGPGDGHKGHTVDEYVSIDGFIDCSNMIYEIVKKKCA